MRERNKSELVKTMGKETTKNILQSSRIHEEFLAMLERGRQIKARRQKEAEEWFAERRRRQQEAAQSGYYNLEWQ